MELYHFTKETGKKITHFDSNFAMSRIVNAVGPVHISCMHVDEDGVIGYHQATVPQLLLVVSGEGVVRGKEDQFVPVKTGEAVFWKKGEWHETKAVKGLTAIVIEGEDLKPEEYMVRI